MCREDPQQMQFHLHDRAQQMNPPKWHLLTLQSPEAPLPSSAPFSQEAQQRAFLEHKVLHQLLPSSPPKHRIVCL